MKLHGKSFSAIGEVISGCAEPDITEFSTGGSGGKSVKEGGRFFSGVINANTLDRLAVMRIDPHGVDFTNFKLSGGPVVVEHQDMSADGRSLTVARVHKARADDTGTHIVSAEFDTDEVAEHWRGKVERGFIRAMSGAFLIKATEFKKVKGAEVMIVTQSDLMHVALTSQPRNAKSLIQSLADVVASAGDEDETAELRAKITQLTASVDGVVARLSHIEELSKRVEEAHQQQSLDQLEHSFKRVAALAQSIGRT